MDERQLQFLKDGGVNVDGVIGRFGGRADLLKKFIVRFLDDKSYGNLVAALDTGSVEEAFLAAHTLKGVASNLGLDSVQNDASEITEILRPKTPDCVDAAKPLLPKLTDSYTKMIDVIKQIAD